MVGGHGTQAPSFTTTRTRLWQPRLPCHPPPPPPPPLSTRATDPSNTTTSTRHSTTSTTLIVSTTTSRHFHRHPRRARSTITSLHVHCHIPTFPPHPYSSISYVCLRRACISYHGFAHELACLRLVWVHHDESLISLSTACLVWPTASVRRAAPLRPLHFHGRTHSASPQANFNVFRAGRSLVRVRRRARRGRGDTFDCNVREWRR